MKKEAQKTKEIKSEKYVRKSKEIVSEKIGMQRWKNSSGQIVQKKKETTV